MSIENGPQFDERNYIYILRQMIGEVTQEDIESLRNKIDAKFKDLFDSLPYEDKMRQVVFDKLSNEELRLISHFADKNEDYIAGLHNLYNQISVYLIYSQRKLTLTEKINKKS